MAQFEKTVDNKYLVVVEDDVWIGHGAIVLSPVRIGRGAIVAAGSVVEV
jgi:acetyltransferase-like isoleucine patch superfamily enzyme